jgi:hypothetical protein
VHVAKLSNPNLSFAVVYIDWVIGSASRARRRAPQVCALLATFVFALTAFGCGSGGDSSNATEADGGAAAPSPGTVAAAPGQRERPEDSPSQSDGKDRKSAGNDAGTGPDAGSPTAGGKGGGRSPGAVPGSDQTRTPAQQAAVERQAARNCPKGISLAQCESLVQGSKQAASAPSYTVTQPEDCLKAMSKEQCEAIYRAQKEAADSSSPGANIQACLQNMTPQCEAILRPIFEQQRAAEEASQ